MTFTDTLTTVLTPATVCQRALDLCFDALAACGYGDLRRVYVAAGEVAWDDCCGQLTCAPERAYQTAIFPVEGPDPNGCYEGTLTVDVVVTLVRCVPVLDDRGQPPDPGVLAEVYADILNQAGVVWNALAYEPLPSGWQRANQAQTFTGAEGGCVGVETRLTLGTDAEGWCPVCVPPP